MATATKRRKIFISYRREDAADAAGRIRDWLVQTKRVTREDVFMDVEAILPGADFVRVIEQAIDQCRALIVVISPSWIAQVNTPNSYVRMEAEIALRREVPVIPVLIGGVQTPPAEQLPLGLQKLTRLNARQVRPDSFDYDMDWIRKALGFKVSAGVRWMAVVSAVLLVAVSLGVLSVMPPGNPILPIFAHAATPTMAAEVTATATLTPAVTPTPALATYRTDTPGTACDNGRATWTVVAGEFSCGGGATSIVPSSSVAELRFAWPDHSFGSAYSTEITISLDKASCASVVTNVTVERGNDAGYYFTACGSGYECISKQDASHHGTGLKCGTWSDGSPSQVSVLAYHVQIDGPSLAFSVGALPDPDADVPSSTSIIKASDITYTATDYILVEVYSPSTQATLTKFSCSIPSA